MPTPQPNAAYIYPVSHERYPTILEAKRLDELYHHLLWLDGAPDPSVNGDELQNFDYLPSSEHVSYLPTPTLVFFRADMPDKRTTRQELSHQKYKRAARQITLVTSGPSSGNKGIILMLMRAGALVEWNEPEGYDTLLIAKSAQVVSWITDEWAKLMGFKRNL